MAVMCIINMHCTAPPAALYFPSVFLPLANWVTLIACEVSGKDSVIKKFQLFWNLCVALQYFQDINDMPNEVFVRKM